MYDHMYHPIKGASRKTSRQQLTGILRVLVFVGARLGANINGIGNHNVPATWELQAVDKAFCKHDHQGQEVIVYEAM